MHGRFGTRWVMRESELLDRRKVEPDDHIIPDAALRGGRQYPLELWQPPCKQRDRVSILVIR